MAEHNDMVVSFIDGVAADDAPVGAIADTHKSQTPISLFPFDKPITTPNLHHLTSHPRRRASHSESLSLRQTPHRDISLSIFLSRDTHQATTAGHLHHRATSRRHHATSASSPQQIITPPQPNRRHHAGCSRRQVSLSVVSLCRGQTPPQAPFFGENSKGIDEAASCKSFPTLISRREGSLLDEVNPISFAFEVIHTPMAKDQSIAVKDAVHKLQLSLLEGIREENRLFAAGSLISQSDYEDVVCERSIANLCGYPLCGNPLPPERPRKGRYRISLKEHKVYDLHETYMYCSTSCVVNSRAFASSLQEERCLILSPAKIDDILMLFGDLSLESKDGMGMNGDLGMSELKIQEKMETKAGEVSLEEWIGPSNAIEGYVPQIDRSSKPSRSKNQKEGSKTSQSKPKTDNSWTFNEMDFMSAIITEDEYSISKTSPGLVKNDSRSKSEGSRSKVEHQLTISEASSAGTHNISGTKSRKSKKERSKVVAKEHNILEVKEEFLAEKEVQFGETMLKSSLKSSGAKKHTRSVTWADEEVDSVENRSLCETKEVEDRKEDCERLSSMGMGDGDNMLRFASAEACAAALSEAAEAVASGESDISDAVSEAGIIILPPSHDVGKSMDDVDMLEVEPAPKKWPTKPGILRSDIFDPEDSWYDAPPEGFSLTLSPFATMWMALFAWVTSSSLACIYGRDESFHEEYLLINGREYPRKIILNDGRSSEIKQTLAGCLARALPGLVGDLRLPVPISTLEQGMGHLLETMTFVDSLPSFRVKQWQVISLLFLDALSVCRIPALTSHLISRRMLLHKVLDGAQISMEEYEAMKDLIIPLGRAPQFSAQSGG